MAMRHPDGDSGVQLAMRLIALASVIVPRAWRRDWRREWEAEVWHCWDRLSRWHRADRAARLRLWSRCSGALVDALWLRSASLAPGSAIEALACAARPLLRTPMATLGSIMTLALGFAATGAALGLASPMLFRTLPVAEPDRLVTVCNTYTAVDRKVLPVSAPEYQDVRDCSRTFEGVAAFDVAGASVSAGGERRPARIANVSPNFFDVIGATPLVGSTRTLNGAGQAVVGFEFFRREMGGAADAVGATIAVGASTYTVAAVMPPEFAIPDRVDVWILREPSAAPAALGGRDARFLSVVGRLRPGVTSVAATRDVAAFVHGATSDGADRPQWGIRILPYGDHLASRVRPTIPFVLAGAALLLALACAVVAGRLVSGTAGGDRSTLGRNLAQSALLTPAGAAIGLGAASAAMALLGEPRLEAGAVGASMALSVVVVVAVGAFALVPRRALDVLQTALALALLVGSVVGACVVRPRVAELGFDPSGVVGFRIALDRRDAEVCAELVRDSIARVRAVPGVDDAGAVSILPLGGSSDRSLVVEGWSPRSANDAPDHECRSVSPTYFDAMRIPVLNGRAFAELDTPESPHVVIVNAAFAARYWPEQRALGRRVRLAGRDLGGWRTVVGVVGNVRQVAADAEPQPEIYLPFAQFPTRSAAIVARTAAGADVDDELAAVAGALRVSDVRRMESVIDESVAPGRRAAVLAGIFAAAALGLAGPRIAKRGWR